ncbi:hypothetical protein [Streptomyces sp. NPDC058086]|uniref:hypothetical protein n=1 Tax=Streptomyces sp. NPDC058086 TaxID=3346334 RepID=UPI0036E69BD5
MDDFDALQRRIDAIIAQAAEADSTCSWGLWQLTKDKHEFGSTYYGSLKDASTDARQAQQTKTDSVQYTPPAKWGSGTIITTGIDFSYTPNQPRTPGDTHVNAPAEPGKMRYQ